MAGTPTPRDLYALGGVRRRGGANVPEPDMEELHHDECRKLLAERHLGRLAIPDFGGLQGRTQEPGQRPRRVDVPAGPEGHRPPAPRGHQARRPGVPGPGGSNGTPQGARTPLSTHNLHASIRPQSPPARTWPTLTCTAPRPAPHLRDLAEDAGIPSRVIDEPMGHQAGRRGEREGSMIGTRYRHMTEAMHSRPLHPDRES